MAWPATPWARWSRYRATAKASQQEQRPNVLAAVRSSIARMVLEEERRRGELEGPRDAGGGGSLAFRRGLGRRALWYY